MGNVATPKSVRKLQTALHAKAKAEAGYRFYALYDRISRDDILAHAYAQCRSNKGAPGIDGQDFADIEAHGVERWLRTGMSMSSSGSHATRRWREMDSNHRSLARKSRFLLRKANYGDQRGSQKGLFLTLYRWFESISLHRRVCCEPVRG